MFIFNKPVTVTVNVTDPQLAADVAALETRVGQLEDAVANLKVANESAKAAAETLRSTVDAMATRVADDTANFTRLIQELKDQVAAGGTTDPATIAELEGVVTDLNNFATTVNEDAGKLASIDPDPENGGTPTDTGPTDPDSPPADPTDGGDTPAPKSRKPR